MMFSFVGPQTIHFGRGQSAQTAALAAKYGTNVLLVHGATASRAQWLIDQCNAASLTTRTIGCATEPALPDITAAKTALAGFQPDVIVALGGGSVMDFAKALSALIPAPGDPRDYLEVVGTGRALENPPIPMIALPTTAGTGAEVTKNAVIQVPDRGIKVSLRDPRMVPHVAIVDADLMQGAPQTVALAAGLDAITQVIEPYLTLKANPMTDALCHAAIPIGLQVIREVVENDDPHGWARLAWVSTCGGLALANAGLGAVHGFAGVIGGKTGAPHGEICGTLLPAVLESHQQKVQPDTEIFIKLQWVIDQIDTAFADGKHGAGIAALRAWSKKMGLRGLGEMGLSQSDHVEVAEASAGASSMKGNPFALTQDDLIAILDAAH